MFVNTAYNLGKSDNYNHESKELKGNSRLILTIFFCIDVNISLINFAVIVYIDDE